MKRAALATLALLGALAASGRAGAPQAGDPRDGLHAAIDPVIEALWSGYDATAAMDHVRFMSQYWRLAGNPGYNATIDRVQSRLSAAGLRTTVEEYQATGPAWDHSAATLAIVRSGTADEVVLSRERERLALCINSFSTPAGGVVAPLIDVGRGDRDEHYAGKTVKGAVVIGDADVGQLWRRAVVTHGAAGVISTSLPAYLNADPPGAKPTPRDEWDILQWGSVPYDEARKGFGFKASPRAAATLRRQLAAGAPVNVRVKISSSFTTGPARTLVAEIPGAAAPAERVVLAAHIQEPGANDNASGAATLAEAAAAMATAIRQKKMPAPGRTLTFLFLNEISGSRRWLQDHPAEAKQVRYMLSLDMTGEDVSKTGGSFLVERYPDPGAVWDRPWDPHSEWGRGNVRADALKGDLINDAHLAVARRVAGRTGWVVKTNPYEGGSDHTVFGAAGVPSVLDWHFTDRYYHTNFDTPDKTSPQEMRNVGVTAGASAWLLASASEPIALHVAGVVAAAGRERVALEIAEGAKLAGAAADQAAARSREAAIVAAWRKWYAEAVRSTSRLLIGPASSSFATTIDRLAATFEAARPDSGTAVSVGRGAPPLALKVASSPSIQQTTRLMGSGEPVGGTFVCGTDAEVPPIQLRWSTVVLAGDGRLYRPCPEGNHTEAHREIRESVLLDEAERSPNLEVRWRRIQALARLNRGLGALVESPTVTAACAAEIQVIAGRRWQPGPVFIALRDDAAFVRRVAADGLATLLAQPGYEPGVAKAAQFELEACVRRERDAEVIALLLEAMGMARYGGDEDRARAEQFLVSRLRGPTAEVLGAVKGLEALFRRAAQRPVPQATRERIRELVFFGSRLVQPATRDQAARIRRLALLALQAARDDDVATLVNAAADADWQVRRLVALRLNLAQGIDQQRVAGQLQQDPDFQVRYEILGPIARHAAQTRLCAPLVSAFDDPSLIVSMRAMDLANASCLDLAEGVNKLIDLADRLGTGEGVDRWHRPSRALTALARVRPDEARRRLADAVAHPVWQVRAAAAAAAGTLAEAAPLKTLAGDSDPNVRNSAIEALFRLKDPFVVDASIAALRESEDHQLLRTAAISLRGAADTRRDEASNALLFALRTLTRRAEDTSRDPRVAILERLGEVLRPERSADLQSWFADVDDEVAGAAIKAWGVLGLGAPAQVSRVRRYPYQPSEAELSRLPREAHLQLEDGLVIIELLPEVAPVTIARFAALARRGYYNGLTFHRIAPNFVVQGGSPGANEYVGTSRYMRDELGGAPHLRGAVGISTRGRDTGDAQIFIDLVDVPRLDRDYTVFGHVRQGMDVVDRMLEGAVIRSVTVR